MPSPQTARLVRFGLVGVTVAALYVALYAWLRALGVPGLPANAAAFGAAVLVQYLAQAGFTFRVPLGRAGQVRRFAAMIACGLGTSALVTGALGPALGLAPAAAALLAACVLPVQNYLFMSRWVFGPARKPLEASS